MGEAIAAAVIAGGLSRRMGGIDKAFADFGGESLIARTVRRARGQAATVFVSASGDPARFASLSLPVIADAVPGYAGPLAGMLTALAHVRAHHPGVAWLQCLACDCPFFPLDLSARLAGAAGNAFDIAVPESRGRLHPVFALLKTSIADTAIEVVARDRLHKVDAWIARHAFVAVPFASEPTDPFFNVNTAEDLRAAQSADRMSS